MRNPRLYVLSFAALSVVTGIVTLLGWAMDIEPFKRVLPSFAAMKPLTAVGFCAGGISLILCCVSRHAFARVLHGGLALGIALMGGASLSQYLGGWSLGMDLWLFPEAVIRENLPHPGRMTPAASLNFLLLGISLLLIDFEPRRGLRPSQVMALAVSLIGMTGLLGYGYGSVSLYETFAYSSMAVHTALLFTLYGPALMLARADRGLVSVLTSPHGGGVMARRILPPLIILPFVVGWLRLQGQALGWYGTGFGLALFATANIFILTILLWAAARKVNHMDRERERNLEFARETARQLGQSNSLLKAEIVEHDRTRDARDRAETELRQAQKMEALGTLAAGIAHDFNNILTAILLNADRGLRNLPSDHPARKHFADIRNSGDRAAELVRQIMTFTRQIGSERVPLQLDELLRETLKAMLPEAPPHLRIETVVETDLPPVLADPSQMKQTIFNLVQNSVQAIGKEVGLVEIALHTTNDGGASREVVMTVRDTGPGIGADVLPRIFDPFFTTKPTGEGTGLGLPVVHGIVKAHRGKVTVESLPGEGTSVRVSLPAAIAATEGGKDRPLRLQRDS